MGDGCRMVITGDITQVDLPRHKSSGLKQAKTVLGGIEDIAFQFLSASDVVRHPVVQSIIEAYERYHDAGTRAHADNRRPERFDHGR